MLSLPVLWLSFLPLNSHSSISSHLLSCSLGLSSMSGRYNAPNDRQEEGSSLLHPPASAVELNGRPSQSGSSTTLVDSSSSDGQGSRAPGINLGSRGGGTTVQSSQITSTVQGDVGPSCVLRLLCLQLHLELLTFQRCRIPLLVPHPTLLRRISRSSMPISTSPSSR